MIRCAVQSTCVVGFSRFLEIGVPDICDSPKTQERNHPSGVSAAGKVWGCGDIAGHRPPMGGGLLALHIHDRVERFLRPVGPRMCSWGLGGAAERLVTPARLLGQVQPRTAKPKTVTRWEP